MALGDMSADAGAPVAADPGQERSEEILRVVLLEPAQGQEGNSYIYVLRCLSS